MDPLNRKAMRSSATPAQPRRQVGRLLIPGVLLVISLVAAWYWFRAGPREGLPEARARILPADIEVSLGSCAETVPHGIRAFVSNRSAELATPIALAAPLRVDFERHVIARRPPSEGERDDLLMTGGDRVNPARIWDRADGRVVATFDGSADNDGPATLSDDGTRVYIGSRPGDPGVWRVDGGAPLGVLRLDRYFAAKGATFTWDGNGVLLTGQTDPHDINTGALIAWDIVRGTHRVLAESCGVTSPRLNDDGTRVTVRVGGCPRAEDERLSTGFAPATRAPAPLDATRQWDIGWKGREALQPPNKWLSHGLLSPDGESLAVWSSSGTASVLDARTGTILGVLSHGSDGEQGSFEPPVAEVSFDAAGDRAAMGDAGGGAVFWDLARREPVFGVAPDAPAVAWLPNYQWSWLRVVALSPDGTKALLGGGQGGDATVWDVASGHRLYAIPGRHTKSNWQHDMIWLWEHVAAAAFSPDGRTVLVVDESARAHLLEAATGRLPRDFVKDGTTGQNSLDLRYQQFSPSGVASFSPDGKRVAVGGDLGPRMIFETETGRYISTLHGADRIERPHIMFSPDGTKIVSAEAQWDVNSGVILGIVRPAHPDTLIGGAGWTRDGRSVVATCDVAYPHVR
jgi:WD40 repeat protein